MKVLLYSLLVISLNSCTPSYLRKVTVLDEDGRPLKGVMRTPRTMIFDKGVTSNSKGKIYTLKGGYGTFMKDGYIPLLIKQKSDADTYTLYRDPNGKVWTLSDLDDIVRSQ
jgi:hypothetical protein